jgi:hypothetical protein
VPEVPVNGSIKLALGTKIDGRGARADQDAGAREIGDSL